MPLVLNVTIDNPEFRDLSNRQRVTEATLQTNRIRLEERQERVRECEEVLALDKALILLLKGEGLQNQYPHASAEFLKAQDLHYKQFETCDLAADQAAISVSTSTKTLADLNEKLDGMRSTAVFTVNKRVLQEQLQNVDGVDHKSACVGVSDTGKPFFRWTYRNLVMTPRYNNIPSINGGMAPSIKLQDIVCTVFPQANEIKLAPAFNEFDQTVPMYASHGTVHPHVLNHHQPCLGDFNGPIVEAITDRDWTTLATVITMFLETADPSDPAGFNWYKLVTGPNGSMPVRLSNEYQGSSAHLLYGFPLPNGKFLHYVQQDDGTWLTQESHHPLEIVEEAKAPEAQTLDDISISPTAFNAYDLAV